jgi:hypothetical protein
MTIGLVEHELFHTDRPVDGRTDVAMLTVAFQNFAKWTKDAYIRAWSGIWTYDPSFRAVNIICLRCRVHILYPEDGRRRYVWNIGNYPSPFIPYDANPSSRRPVKFASGIFNLLAKYDLPSLQENTPSLIW